MVFLSLQYHIWSTSKGTANHWFAALLPHTCRLRGLAYKEQPSGAPRLRRALLASQCYSVSAPAHPARFTGPRAERADRVEATRGEDTAGCRTFTPPTSGTEPSLVQAVKPP